MTPNKYNSIYMVMMGAKGDTDTVWRIEQLNEDPLHLHRATHRSQDGRAAQRCRCI